MDNTQETSADVIANMYRGPIPQHRHDRVLLCHFADRFEAALKREMDNIHRAMVILAGIEMESTENPPRLWTALEDAYDALSDALGTDGDTTADEEEAKATGRHFVVVRPSGDCAKLREALGNLRAELWNNTVIAGKRKFELYEIADAALAAPPRNCDKYTSLDEARNAYMAINEMPEGNRDEDMRQWLCDFHHWLFALAKEGGAK